MSGIRIFIALNLILLVTSFGCSSGKIKVSSYPEQCEVWVIHPDGKEVKAGVTPVEINMSYFNEYHLDLAKVRVSKSGFYPESIILPKTLLPTNVSFFASLKENESSSTLGHLTDQITKILGLVQQKKLFEAKELAIAMTTQFPNISVGFDLLGNIYYLMHDVPNALAAYKKSKLLSPGNVATENMIQKLSQFYNKDRQIGEIQ